MSKRILIPLAAISLFLNAPLMAQNPPEAKAAVQTPAASTNAPPARLDILVRKNLNKNKTSSVTTQESYAFSVQIRNEETTRAHKELSSELYILSVDKADESMFNLLVRQHEAFDLPPRGEHEFETALFAIKHTETSGSELAGYILVITDALGRTVAMKSSRPSFEKNLERIRTAPVSTSKKKAFRLE